MVAEDPTLDPLLEALHQGDRQSLRLWLGDEGLWQRLAEAPEAGLLGLLTAFAWLGDPVLRRELQPEVSFWARLCTSPVSDGLVAAAWARLYSGGEPGELSSFLEKALHLGPPQLSWGFEGLLRGLQLCRLVMAPALRRTLSGADAGRDPASPWTLLSHKGERALLRRGLREGGLALEPEGAFTLELCLG